MIMNLHKWMKITLTWQGGALCPTAEKKQNSRDIGRSWSICDNRNRSDSARGQCNHPTPKLRSKHLQSWHCFAETSEAGDVYEGNPTDLFAKGVNWSFGEGWNCGRMGKDVGRRFTSRNSAACERSRLDAGAVQRNEVSIVENHTKYGKTTMNSHNSES
jgi:hypothetical protein